MFNLANQLLRSLSGSLGNRRRSQRRNTGYNGQQLEIRQVPTVTASLSAAGALSLTGDNTSNDITVEGNMATGEVLLMGNNGTKITLNGVTAVQHSLPHVNSLSGTFGTQADVVTIKNLTLGKVTMNLGEGADDLTMDNLFANGVTLNLGNGDNDVGISNARFGTTSITGGNDKERIHIDETKVGGALTIKTGSGVDQVFFNSGLTGAVKVHDAVTIQTGDGDDFVNFFITGFEFGSLALDTGLGDDDIFNLHGNILGTVNISTGDGKDFLGGRGTWGAATINMGTGLNTLDMHGVTAKSLALTTGAMRDRLFLSEVTISGATTINTGDGEDDLDFDKFGLAESDFAALTINLGNGYNALISHKEISTDALSITSGTGGDIINLDAKSQGDWTIKTGADIDLLTLKGGTTGKLTLETSDGDDNINAYQFVVQGNASIKTGIGDDALRINLGNGQPNLFGGTLLVDMGAENDSVRLQDSRVSGATTLVADKITIDDARFQGAFKATAKGSSGNSSISVEQTFGFAGETVFEKDAQLIINQPTTESIMLGTGSANSKVRFQGAAKFQGVSADPVDVRVEVLPTTRVFFNGSAPTFTNAKRVNV